MLIDLVSFAIYTLNPKPEALNYVIWVVVKTMVPFWVLNTIRHVIFRVPKKGP